ncbi:hypothetical protein ACET3X_000367 [Alternaria dauci]|uniref:Uncharacterized protein n=1 Tax=Alternaria dauci TaxID=48095 RepID=A0ABR3UU71_9PLEO
MSNPQAVQQRHAINRIFTLVIEIFTLVTRVADPRVLLRQETVNNELHLFYCHREDLGDEFVAQQTGYTSIDAEDALRSHNYCVFVCKIFAGILAWLIEDLHLPITVEEVDLNDVSATQPVVCIDVINWEQKRVAPIHTMFKILDSGAYPQSDGLVEEDGSYIDASAAQYLRPAGIYAVCSYPARPRSSTRLGGAYKTQLDRLHRIGMNKGYRAEAIIRTVNNEFYAKMVALGGPRILLDKDKAKWADFEREIVASIETSLRSLVTNLDRQDIDDHYTETHHKLIARACFGAGHDMITKALERVSGHEGIVLLQSI